MPKLIKLSDPGPRGDEFTKISIRMKKSTLYALQQHFPLTSRCDVIRKMVESQIRILEMDESSIFSMELDNAG